MYLLKEILIHTTVVPGFRILGFSALPGFSALNPGDGAWSVHKTLFGFSAPVFQGKISFKAKKIFFLLQKTYSLQRVCNFIARA